MRVFSFRNYELGLERMPLLSHAPTLVESLPQTPSHRSTWQNGKMGSKKLKSERHHWWPECVSQHWAGDDGKTGWLRPDGTCLRVAAAELGVIRDGHHIRVGSDQPSPWDMSFERVFDRADNGFPQLIKWLELLDRRTVCDAQDLRQRFTAQRCNEDDLLLMTECAVSLAVRGPMNRQASVAIADDLRGPIKSSERNALIGVNMRNSQRIAADSIGSRGKFVAVYSQSKEFVFGDGFFHNIVNVQMAPHQPKMFVPVTPNICILVCRPSSYSVEPRLSTLVLDDREADICNHAVQIYAKNAIYFRSQQPALHDDFRRAEHLRYGDPRNPLDSLIRSIPGVATRKAWVDLLP